MSDISFSFTYYYGNGDSYSGYGYADSSLGYYEGQTIGYGYNETGNYGYYYISSFYDYGYDAYGLSAGSSIITIDSYFDGGYDFDGDGGNPVYRFADEVYSYGGNYGLGSEYGYAYYFSSVFGTGDEYFDTYESADLSEVSISNELYYFTYTYGNGDYYYGYVYDTAGTYYQGQIVGYYGNETGNSGYYTIDSVYSGYDSYSNGSVYVTSYYDGDTGYGYASAYGDGYSGLGSEYGYAYDYYGYGYGYDSYFSNYNEADVGSELYYFTYNYGNGDWYSGYGYASSGSYYTGQVIDYIYNETGNYGYYTIDSVYSGYDSYSNGSVYVTSYYDGDTGYGYAYDVYGYGYSGLGSESGDVYDYSGYGYDSYFSNYNEADVGSELYNDLYYFTYNYGNGDWYNGYGYASSGNYYTGQVIDYIYNETGNYGYYTIDSVYSGYYFYSNGSVYVTSYYDGDTGYGYASAYGDGYSGLGSEYGYAYDYSGYNYDSYFNNYNEADVGSELYNDLYYFTYNYGNGDWYNGYGYASSGSYYTGQVIDYIYNETGNYGYYTIDSVYSVYDSYSNGSVYVTSYYDGDTGYGYASAYGDGYSGLGSESGDVYDYSGYSLYFSNYNEADLTNFVDPQFAFDLVEILTSGSDLQILGATYSGSVQSAAIFSDSSLNLGINSGIVLSTGDVDDLYGSNDSSSTTSSLGTAGDPDLDAIVSGSTNDASVLEFDFVANSSFLSFQYVFGSEEYNEYVGSQFNDVFAFLLIDSAGNTQNIAVLPGSDTPIAINNVNNEYNATYYRDNTSGYFTTELDGLTTVLTAVASVNPGETYRFKLAIADVGDSAYDSAVSLKGGTFQTTPIVAVSDSFSLLPGSPSTTLNVLGNDLSDGSSNFSIGSFQDTSNQGGIVILLENEQFLYTPPTGFVGEDGFGYTLVDELGNTSTGSVSIQVGNNDGGIYLSLNLREDNGGVPGDLISADTVALGDTFFIEILAGDFRTNASGLVGLALDLNWDPSILEALSYDITNSLPFAQQGTLDNLTGLADNLGGGSIPGLGQPIGINEYEQFALIQVQSKNTTLTPSDLTISDVNFSNIALADGTVPSSLVLEETQTVSVLHQLQVQINILEDNNGVPGSILASGEIPVGNTFFVEVLVGDIRPNAAGIVGGSLDVQWDPSQLEALSFSISNNLPFAQQGTLNNATGLANDLGGGSIPGVGQPIGVNQLERFALIRFEGELESVDSLIQVLDLKQFALADAIVVDTNIQESTSIDIISAPEISILDSSGTATDQSIRFTTPLSLFRNNTSDSNFVRPSYADTRQYVDLSNSGDGGVLVISGIQVNATDVSIDYNFTTQGDILLNPGETQRIGLRYAPTAAGQNFNLADGLVIFSNAENDPDAQVTLAGRSTYNADISYDGVVSFGDLGPLTANWGRSSTTTPWDPTADINGDGSISFGDLGQLSAQWGQPSVA